MGNVISHPNKTTWPNTDARLKPGEFYGKGINQKISIREMGGVAARNDCAQHLSQSAELKHEEGMKEAITELKSLMCGHHIRNNSPGNLKMPGALADRIAKR